MKKVLVLAAAIALFATPSFAAITGTLHDLSQGTGNPVSGTITEICVYCHTPHGADTTVANAPLWNRGTTNATVQYAGLDLQAVATLTTINASDAPLCLSCHNGAGVTGALQNAPNSGGAVPVASVGAAADLGTDLSDDHPIGFNYDAVATADTEIHPLATATGNGVKFFDDGSGTKDMMWCSSCHDVHDNTNVPFLNTPILNSGLCLDCHIK